jgi:hypothetical protein
MPGHGRRQEAGELGHRAFGFGFPERIGGLAPPRAEDDRNLGRGGQAAQQILRASLGRGKGLDGVGGLVHGWEH